jgi:hypothetical protein
MKNVEIQKAWGGLKTNWADRSGLKWRCQSWAAAAEFCSLVISNHSADVALKIFSFWNFIFFKRDENSEHLILPSRSFAFKKNAHKFLLLLWSLLLKQIVFKMFRIQCHYLYTDKQSLISKFLHTTALLFSLPCTLAGFEPTIFCS